MSKPANNSLQLVLNKEKKEQDAIGGKVNKISIFIENEKSQERSLREYQQEYIKKIREQKQCTIAEVNRYRGFCYQLDHALTQQQTKIQLAEKHLDELRKLLMVQQHKISVLANLIEKKAGEAAYNEEKVAQKFLDELAARGVQNKLRQ
jgi:flagellar export protein FliJ